MATGEWQPLIPQAQSPTRSPDGSQLGYVRLVGGYQTALEDAAPDGSGARQIIDGQRFVDIYAPRFAPNSTQILFSAIGGPQSDAQGSPMAPPDSSIFKRLAEFFAPPTAAAHGERYEL